MMIFEEIIDKNIEIPFEYNNEDKIYVLKNDNDFIGYGKIILNQDNKDILYFMIKPEYQSNGYGTMLYEKLLQVLKDNNYKDIVIHISNDNIKAINIINKFRNIHTTTIKGISEYIVPIM